MDYILKYYVYIVLNTILQLLFVMLDELQFAVARPSFSDMDDGVCFCPCCGGRTVSDAVVKVTSKEVVMLYDLDRARQLLSGATLADLPQSNLSLKPEDQPGKTCIAYLKLLGRILHI